MADVNADMVATLESVEGRVTVVVRPLYYIAGHPLLSPKWFGLDDEDQRRAQQELAEMLLGLRPPAYVDADGDAIVSAIVQQVNFQLAQDMDPLVLQSSSTAAPGATTAYRDRYVSPRAWSILERVTGVRRVAFRATD